MKVSYSNTTVVKTLLALAALGAPLCEGAQKPAPALPPTAHWTAFADTAIGGASSMNAAPSPAGPGNKHQAVKLEGELKRKFAFPYCGAQAFFQAGQKPLDLRAFTGIQFWTRGDGHTFLLQVPTVAVTDFNFFSKGFPTSKDWTLVKIPFKDLVQTIPFGKKLEWTGQDVTGVGFEAVGFVGPFSFEAGEISVY